VVAANVYLAENEKVSGVFNVAYGKSISINELAKQIIDLTGSKSRIQYAPVRPGDVKHSLAAVGKLNAAGMTLNDNFNAGLMDTISFFSAAR